MARVIAPFIIKGSIQDLNFYVDDGGVNRAREKNFKGVSPEDYRNSPSYQKVRNHSKEFGRCIQKAKSFRMTAFRFFERAKDGSFAGRANKLMLDVINEDTVNIEGERTIENGMESADARSYFVGFEGNKHRPLGKVLKTEGKWDAVANEFTLKDFNLTNDLDWPEKAQQVHFAVAHCVWNYTNETFKVDYSEEIIITKSDTITDLNLKTESFSVLKGEVDLVFLFIGFSYQDRKRVKELKRSFNTASIVWSK